MKLHELQYTEGARKARKRVGRGTSSGNVFLRPASQGTGIIAGGPVRAVVELAGYRDILSKCIGSRTPINMVRATMQGLASLKTVNEVAELREKTVDEIFG